MVLGCSGWHLAGRELASPIEPGRRCASVPRHGELTHLGGATIQHPDIEPVQLHTTQRPPALIRGEEQTKSYIPSGAPRALY